MIGIFTQKIAEFLKKESLKEIPDYDIKKLKSKKIKIMKLI